MNFKKSFMRSMAIYSLSQINNPKAAASLLEALRETEER